MHRGVILIFLCFSAWLGFADEARKPTPPTPPGGPTGPAKPVVPGATGNTSYPRLPVFPRPPDNGNRSNETVREVEKYDLAISGAFPSGNMRNNVANTIRSAHYTLYSNRTAQIKLVFQNGSEYIYHLRNPRSKVEIGPGSFRETVDAVVQAGREFLLEQYLGELYYNDNTVTSFSLMGDGRVVVTLIFSKKA